VGSWKVACGVRAATSRQRAAARSNLKALSPLGRAGFTQWIKHSDQNVATNACRSNRLGALIT
jgi:hypothetical protein